MLLIVSMISILVIGYLGWSWARAELRETLFDHLASIRSAKAYQLESYFTNLKHHLETLCEDRMVVTAMKEFNEAYDELNQKSIPAEWDKAIETYYSKEFLPRLSKNILGTPNFETYAPQSPAARYLQYHYIAHNPHPVGEKDALQNAGDDSKYSNIHTQYHKLFRDIIKKFGYYDLFLIDPKNGEIVYSVDKETDFATNLSEGPYSRSNLGNAIASVQDNPDRDAITVVDFQFYRASYGAPAAFIAGPILDGSQLVGILAVQMPVDEINDIVTGHRQWQGLGKTGETYLVGSDFLMRSSSRFSIEKPEDYKATLRARGTKEETIQLISNIGTSILLQKIDTKAAKAVIKHGEGSKITQDYRGIKVLSSYSRLNLPGLDWAIVSEIDIAEAYKSLYSLQSYLFTSTVILVLVVTFVAGVAAAKFVKPIKAMVEASEKVAAGEADVELVVDTQDEYKDLADIFNQIIKGFRQQNHEVEQKYRQSESLLSKLLPKTVADRLKKGEKEINDSIPQATVMFASITGLRKLEADKGVKAVAEQLNELIDSLDELTDRYDVEKLKVACDRYIAICGLTKPRLDHEKRMMDFALKALDITQGINNRLNTRLGLGIGIHAGRVTAGIIGTQKFSYDLWGETVVIASYLNTQAEANAIVVTQSVRDRLGDSYEFEHGKAIDVEGNRLNTWVLRKRALTDLIGALTGGLDLDAFDEFNDGDDIKPNKPIEPPKSTINQFTSSFGVAAFDDVTKDDVQTTAPSVNKTTSSPTSSFGQLTGDLGIDDFDDIQDEKSDALADSKTTSSPTSSFGQLTSDLGIDDFDDIQDEKSDALTDKQTAEVTTSSFGQLTGDLGIDDFDDIQDEKSDALADSKTAEVTTSSFGQLTGDLGIDDFDGIQDEKSDALADSKTAEVTTSSFGQLTGDLGIDDFDDIQDEKSDALADRQTAEVTTSSFGQLTGDLGIDDFDDIQDDKNDALSASETVESPTSEISSLASDLEPNEVEDIADEDIQTTVLPLEQTVASSTSEISSLASDLEPNEVEDIADEDIQTTVLPLEQTVASSTSTIESIASDELERNEFEDIADDDLQTTTHSGEQTSELSASMMESIANDVEQIDWDDIKEESVKTTAQPLLQTGELPASMMESISSDRFESNEVEEMADENSQITDRTAEQTGGLPTSIIKKLRQDLRQNQSVSEEIKDEKVEPTRIADPSDTKSFITESFLQNVLREASQHKAWLKYQSELSSTTPEKHLNIRQIASNFRRQEGNNSEENKNEDLQTNATQENQTNETPTSTSEQLPSDLGQNELDDKKDDDVKITE
ncbi:adenylate/guanylate cyclase domain-containing protein [Aerosakkonema funiforme]|nr:adenylate/guanylate cyclase domain-containing protein [Aerosakkonema funiforme]